jgi:transposase-like protein
LGLKGWRGNPGIPSIPAEKKMEGAMKYSKRIKSSVMKKILPPENKSVPEVAKEMGISEQTIYNWKKMAGNGSLTLDAEASPVSLGRIEKLSLLLEGKGKSEDTIGSWLREKGLHSEHLTLWEQELQDILKDKDTEYREENARLKKEKRELEKELRRKEKALAEMAALLTLKKKASEIWGDREDV